MCRRLGQRFNFVVGLVELTAIFLLVNITKFYYKVGWLIIIFKMFFQWIFLVRVIFA